MSTTPTGSTQKPGRGFSIAGIVCVVAGIFLFPIILGPAGAVLGFVGNAKGDNPFGKYVGIGAIVVTVIVLILSAVLYNNLAH